MVAHQLQKKDTPIETLKENLSSSSQQSKEQKEEHSFQNPEIFLKHPLSTIQEDHNQEQYHHSSSIDFDSRS